MDPITKALHETWKKIVSEDKITYTPYTPFYDPMSDMSKPPTDNGGWEILYDRKLVGLNYKPRNRWIRKKDAPERPLPSWFPKPKPTPTPGDGSWGGSKPKPGTGAWGGAQPGKPIYGPDGNLIGVEDNTTPTPKPTSGYDRILPDKENPNDNIRGKYPVYQDKIPSIPIRTPAPQSTVPATTGSGLLNSVLNANKKMYNSVTGSLPSMPKIYEERDTEGQMAIGELKVLAQKAQELASMMKDDTQLEAWVQSKITKAKDYISSVHDYMNGNPDKID